MINYSFLNQVEHDLYGTTFLHSSAARAVCYSGCVVTVLDAFTLRDGAFSRVYEFAGYDVGAYLLLKDSYSFGKMFHRLGMYGANSARFDRSEQAHRRPFQVFVINESVDKSLLPIVKYKSKVNQLGSYLAPYAEADISLLIKHKKFTQENHGVCMYQVKLYSLNRVEASLMLVPSSVSGEDTYEEIPLFWGELEGDFELQIRRFA